MRRRSKSGANFGRNPVVIRRRRTRAIFVIETRTSRLGGQDGENSNESGAELQGALSLFGSTGAAVMFWPVRENERADDVKTRRIEAIAGRTLAARKVGRYRQSIGQLANLGSDPFGSVSVVNFQRQNSWKC